MEIPQISRHRLHRTWSFQVLVLQRTVNKCTKIYNARAQLLFCTLNLLFGDVLIAVVVVVCLNNFVTQAYYKCESRMLEIHSCIVIWNHIYLVTQQGCN